MANKQIITIEEFAIWEPDPDNPTVYVRQTPDGQEYHVDVLADDSRLMWKNLDHYSPIKLANCSNNYKIWTKINYVDAERLLHLWSAEFPKSWFAVYETKNVIYRVRLKPLKDALITRQRHIKEARKHRAKILEQQQRVREKEALLHEAVEKLEHDLRLLYDTIIKTHVPNILTVKPRLYEHAMRKAARTIGVLVYEITPYHELGLRSLESLRTGQKTPEHIHSRQKMGRAIVDFLIENIKKDQTPPFEEFIKLVYKANEIVFTTSEENTKLSSHQNSDDDPSPNYAYLCAGIVLVREKEYQIHERWQILADAYGIEMLPPYEFKRVLTMEEASALLTQNG